MRPCEYKQITNLILELFSKGRPYCHKGMECHKGIFHTADDHQGTRLPRLHVFRKGVTVCPEFPFFFYLFP